MDESVAKNERVIGSVKAAISRYGKQNSQVTDARKTFQKDTPEDLEMRASKAQELHIAKTAIDRISANKKMSETVISQAELELIKAKKFVRELTSQIEELKSRAKQREQQTLNKAKRVGDQGTLEAIAEVNNRYSEVMLEVEALKRELSKIKLDMARALEEKTCAEKEADAAGLRVGSYINTAEQLRRETEEANEEEVLVELARIQARKELAAIVAQRNEEAEKFSSLLQETRKKIDVLSNEVEQGKYLEENLAMTRADVEMLQNELKLIKDMDKRTETCALSKNSDLQPFTKDLEAARKELALIQAGGCKLMSGMDLIRIELKKLVEEKIRLEKQEEKTEKTIMKLNSKLLRSKDKLEAATASEEKAVSMLPSLALYLKKLEEDKEAARKEKKSILEETASIRDDILKTESQTDSTEERLQAAMQELEAAKSAEANSLKRLKVLAENAVINRASKTTSTITISKFEYEYLTGCASGAEDMANKKVAAAHAWAEALKANEKEMKIKIKCAERNIKKLKLKEEQEYHEIEKLLNATEQAEPEQNVQGRKSVAENSYSMTPARQTKLRKSFGSPAVRRVTTSTSLTAKRRKKVLLKLFKNEQIENQKPISLEGSDQLSASQ